MRMQWGPILLCLWPGLAQLWVRGNWTSLITAIGFSLLLNLALISSFVWPQWLGESFPKIAWSMIILVWAVSLVATYRNLGDLLSVGHDQHLPGPKTPDTLFIQAQREYLKGHWAEAESLIRRRLEQCPRDVEARLLMATQYRRLGRLNQATSELNAISRLDESVYWNFEICRERELIRAAERNDTHTIHELADQALAEITTPFKSAA